MYTVYTSADPQYIICHCVRGIEKTVGNSILSQLPGNSNTAFVPTDFAQNFFWTVKLRSLDWCRWCEWDFRKGRFVAL